MAKIILATEQGIVIGERKASSWAQSTAGLKGQQVTSVIARKGVNTITWYKE